MWELRIFEWADWGAVWIICINSEDINDTFDSRKIITGSSRTFSILGIHFIKGQLHSYCPYSIINIHGWHGASCCADMILVAAFERMYTCGGSRQRDTAQRNVCMGSMYRIWKAHQIVMPESVFLCLGAENGGGLSCMPGMDCYIFDLSIFIYLT